MKNLLKFIIVLTIFLSVNINASAQNENLNFVHVTQLKTRWPENGTMKERDSLVAIYNEAVVKKNQHILSHREYSHFFTSDNKDYMIVEEYKNFAAWEAAGTRTEELEKAAWPDEAKRKAFFSMLDKYFEIWHGDALYRTNPALNKN